MNPFDNSLIVIDEVHNLRTWRMLRLLTPSSSLCTTSFWTREGAKLLCCLDPRHNPFEFAFMVNLLRGPLIDHKFTWNRTLGEEVASIKDIDQCSRVDRSMVTASGATIYICPEGSRVFGQGERDCENVIGNNIEYIKLGWVCLLRKL
jgi:hypothetical protein